MSIIKKLLIKNFLGVDELGLDASKVNIFKGPKGSGKSSILEAIEKTFTNKNRRTEVIKHGEEEATLFVELDDGLEVDRRIRSEKSDYLKLRKGNEGIPSTEKFLRDLINGYIFRPLDWVNMNIKEQTKSILNMLKIDWSQKDIEKWFGEIPSNIEYDQHILMVLKAIETKYFKDREEVNRKIKELKIQIKNIKDELPADYDGEVWRNKSIQEYYSKVSEAQKINQYIEQAKSLQEGFETKVQAIKANAESDKSRIQLKYRDQRQDIKDIIDLSKSKIEKSKSILATSDKNFQAAIKESEVDASGKKQKIEVEHQDTLKKLEDEYMKKVAEETNLYTDKIEQLDFELDESKTALKKLNESTKESEKDNIHLQENKITQKAEELNSLDALEKRELEAVGIKVTDEVEKEKIRVGKAVEYLENNEPVDIEPLQKAADEVSEMREYLRQWDNMINIRDNKLAEKEQYSATLTAKIDTARTLPSELLKTAKMPIDGISVDGDGLIRINGTLIDGLSDGEKFELAMKIAKAQAGELKVICLDGFEKLNPKAQEEFLKTIEDDEFQYFITATNSDEFQIEKLG
jgi:recombinational DNA repair ATPase RecF